jgi:hypothetical protein
VSIAAGAAITGEKRLGIRMNLPMGPPTDICGMKRPDPSHPVSLAPVTLRILLICNPALPF